MKKSLKSALTEMIWSRGYVSMAQVEEYCKAHRYRLSNAERRLRESESPTIEAVREKGYIIGYKPKRQLTEKIAAINNLNPFKEKSPQESLF